MRRSRLLAAVLAVVVAGTALVAGSADAQTIDDPGSGGPSDQQIPRPVLTGQCIKPEQGKELYGPTDVNAQAGNQGLTVAFNDRGTVTVFKWPSPSFYDQVKFHANSRSEPFVGALENEGTFLGIAVTTADGERTVWLRDADEITQRHPEGYTDELITSFRFADLDLDVEVTDVVAHPDDILFREVVTSVGPTSPVSDAALVVHENMNLVVTKIPGAPARDWCGEGLNADTASYDPDLDAIVHSLTGIDESTQRPSSVAVAIGFVEASDGHQVGGDAYEPLAAPDGKVPGPTQDAYDDAADGRLTGNDSYVGQTTGAMRTPLDLTSGTATATAVYTAAADAETAGALLASARTRRVDDEAAAKRAWLEGLLGDFPLPDTSTAGERDAIDRLIERALVTLVTNIDRESKAIVASVATQSPYGEDWPRDGAFFDLALDLGGLHDVVVDRQGFYAATQQTVEDPDPFLTALGVPPGNWGMNYYADGVVGGPIPWEIDETGYAVWNFWQHHRATGDLDALRAIWPTLSAAADFLATCADPTNGLQCRAIEDDNPDLRQTNVGASATWMALSAATEAATALGEDEAAQRYATRRDELGAAIDEHLWIEDPGHYGPGAVAVTAWPACFKDFDHPRMVSHLDRVWDLIAPTFREPQAGEKVFGLYEAKGLISLAKAWKDQPENLAMVRDGIDWIAREHATDDTHIMGEVWQVEDGEVLSIVSQPHAWEQILVYLAALEAYPPDGFADVGPGCDGVLGALRDARLPAGPDTTAAPDDPADPDVAADAPSAATLPATGGRDAVAPALLLALAALVVIALRTRHDHHVSDGGTP